MQRWARSAIIVLAGTAGPACADRVDEASLGRESGIGQADRRERAMNGPQKQGQEGALPYARGRSFDSLDEYLAHLEKQGALDLPYWREIAPGLYERVTSRVPRNPPERASRAELMRRFGFSR